MPCLYLFTIFIRMSPKKDRTTQNPPRKYGHSKTTAKPRMIIFLEDDGNFPTSNAHAKRAIARSGTSPRGKRLSEELGKELNSQPSSRLIPVLMFVVLRPVKAEMQLYYTGAQRTMPGQRLRECRPDPNSTPHPNTAREKSNEGESTLCRQTAHQMSIQGVLASPRTWVVAGGRIDSRKREELDGKSGRVHSHHSRRMGPSGRSEGSERDIQDMILGSTRLRAPTYRATARRAQITRAEGCASSAYDDGRRTQRERTIHKVLKWLDGVDELGVRESRGTSASSACDDRAGSKSETGYPAAKRWVNKCELRWIAGEGFKGRGRSVRDQCPGGSSRDGRITQHRHERAWAKGTGNEWRLHGAARAEWPSEFEKGLLTRAELRQGGDAPETQWPAPKQREKLKSTAATTAPYIPAFVRAISQSPNVVRHLEIPGEAKEDGGGIPAGRGRGWHWRFEKEREGGATRRGRDGSKTAVLIGVDDINIWLIAINTALIPPLRISDSGLVLACAHQKDHYVARQAPDSTHLIRIRILSRIRRSTCAPRNPHCTPLRAAGPSAAASAGSVCIGT
ncbi:hypothetical protein B0H17DRAFT_1149636 [Mycena rosella]|uniref:Uncharacterized protein n=1 Tax=Mycena rosella TaxID=1033263 RepID=A0AAD7C081_MYCRO|nr:hypothetical protein B0H17DRAFT_1149636 [Mycena rosella]